MEPNSQLRQNLRADSVADQEQATTQNQAGVEFATPEELLRHDRAQTPLPEAVATRLESSLRAAPTPTPAGKSWWKRLLE